MAATPRLAVLASGEGSTLQAVLDATVAGRLGATVAIVISNNRDSRALKRAQAAAVPAVHLSSQSHPEPEHLDQAILDALATANADMVLLAGYLKKLGPRVLAQYRGRIINTHPALLPKFGGKGMYGNRVHNAVLAASEVETGVSVHLVDAEYDTGRVLAQCRVPVLTGDTAAGLATRVQAREREFLVEVLGRLLREFVGGPLQPLTEQGTTEVPMLYAAAARFAAALTYRRLQAGDDLNAITRLLHAAYAPLAAAGMRYVASHQDVATTRRRMSHGETFVAVLDNAVVGVVTLADGQATHGSPFYDRPDVASFGQFAVLPALQRQGIGSRLIHIVEQRAREKGVVELALDTSEHAETLIAMYTTRGYRFIEYAKWDSVNYRSVILSKQLR